jgi:hypothetical protein
MLMREIWTGTEIDAPASTVWDIISDLEGYQDWNPFIVEARGELRPRGRVRARIANGRKPRAFTARVLHVQPERLIAWRGHLGVPGIFDGTHVIEIEPVDEHRTRVVQRERFNGVVLPFARKKLAEKEQGFKAMNEALAARAEVPAAA